MPRRRRKAETHVRLYRHELQSAAWRSLSPEARALLVEVRAFYTGCGPNAVHLSVRNAMDLLGVSQRPAQRAIAQLLDRGFLRLIERGSFNRKIRHAAVYALTNEPMDDRPGAVAPKDFMRWTQKFTVAESTRPGSGIDYRDPAKEAVSEAQGSASDYLNGAETEIHGSARRYTDRLPGVGAVLAGDRGGE
jgi:hypothetical protein